MSTAFVGSVVAAYSDLAGRHALVTGGGSGIGAAVVAAFARQGARVTFLDVNDEASTALVGEIGGQGRAAPRYIHCDLAAPDAVEQAIADAESASAPIDILVNNAANDSRHTLDELTPAEWDQCLSINLAHQFFTARVVLAGMKRRRAGVLVNMSSTTPLVGAGGMSAYSAAKAGVIGLSRGIARDYGVYGIRCNVVAPGWVMTERQLKLWYTEAAGEKLLDRQCLKAKLYPEDIAQVVMFLASAASGAMTGQTIVADAGYL
jgi:D-xylose 1-dehydrogenase